jgi:hypothetical protein
MVYYICKTYCKLTPVSLIPPAYQARHELPTFRMAIGSKMVHHVHAGTHLMVGPEVSAWIVRPHVVVRRSLLWLLQDLLVTMVGSGSQSYKIARLKPSVGNGVLCIQGCQIFLDTIYQNGENNIWPQNMYQTAIEYSKWLQSTQNGN